MKFLKKGLIQTFQNRVFSESEIFDLSVISLLPDLGN